MAKTTSLHEQQGDLPSVLRFELSLNLYCVSVRDQSSLAAEAEQRSFITFGLCENIPGAKQASRGYHKS